MKSIRLSSFVKKNTWLLAPKSIIGASLSFFIIIFSLLVFGVPLQKSIDQLISYFLSDFEKIDNSIKNSHKNVLINTSQYSSFYYADELIKCESFMKLKDVVYDSNFIHKLNINNLKEDEIIISQNIAREYNLRKGDKINCDFSLQRNPIEYNVADIFSCFYGLERQNFSLDGVIIIGEIVSYASNNNLVYTEFLTNNDNNIYSKDIILKSNLIKNIRILFLHDFILFAFLACLAILVNASSFFWLGFSYLQALKQCGGAYYKKKLNNISIFSFITLITIILVSYLLITFFVPIYWPIIFLLFFVIILMLIIKNVFLLILKKMEI